MANVRRRSKKDSPPLDAAPCLWVLAQEDQPAPDMAVLLKFVNSFRPTADRLDTYVSQELPHIRVLEYLYDPAPIEVRRCTKTESWEAAFVLCQRLRKEGERGPTTEGVTHDA